MIPVELRFKKMDDFAPAAVAEQITPLRKLMERRKSLANLRSSLMGNEKLESLLQDALNNTDKLRQLGSEEVVRPREDDGKEGN